MEIFQLEHLGTPEYPFVDQGLDILIQDVLFFICQIFKFFKHHTQLIVGEVVPHIGDVGIEGVAAAVFAQDQAVLADSHGFGFHYLIGHGVLEHSVLVNARLVGKGVGSHNGAVGLNHYAGDHAHQPAGGIDPSGVYAGHLRKKVGPGGEGHDHLLQGGVAGSLSDSVNGHLNLPGSGLDRSQGVGSGQPQIVVTVDAQDGLVHVGGVLYHIPDEICKFIGNSVAHGVRQVDGGGTGFYHRPEDLAEKIRITPGAVLG